MKIKTYLALLALLNGAAILSSAYATPQTKSAAPKSNSAQEQSARIGVDGAKSLQFNQQGVDAIKSNDFTAAESYFRQSLKTDASNLSAAYNLAGMYVANKSYEKAIQLLEEYVEKVPNDVSLAQRLGDAYFANKNIKHALKYYEKAHALQPKDNNLGNKLATVYALTNRLEDAQRLLLAIINNDQRDVQALASLSSLFLAMGNPDQAISTARRGLQVESRKDLYLTLGAAYEAKQDKPAALIAYQRAHDLGNTSEELKTKIEELR